MKKISMTKKLKLAFGVGLLAVSASSMAKDGANIPPSLSSSEEHGCKAYLCFAGGLGESACQSTIKKVHRDLARGKAFPHCSFIGDSKNGVISAGEGTPKIQTSSTRKNVYVYVDGKQVAKIKK